VISICIKRLYKKNSNLYSNIRFLVLKSLGKKKKLFYAYSPRENIPNIDIKHVVSVKKNVDSLSKDSSHVSYRRPSQLHNGFHEWKGVLVHKRCNPKVKIPKAWKKL